MTQLTLIRHGQTLWNQQHRMQGHSDSPLTGVGVRQAELLAQRLAGSGFGMLYSSDSGRARHTARIVAASTGHQVIVDRRLRERNFGVFEGLTGAEIMSRYPDVYARFKMRDVAYAIPGGESLLEFRARAMDGLNDIAARHAGEAVVVISHGMVLDVLYRTALGIPFEERRVHELVNAGINRFVLQDGEWRLEVWGDRDHLQEGLLTVR